MLSMKGVIVMTNKLMKNIDYAAVLPFADLVSYQSGQVVSKTLSQNENVSLTLFAFDKGEEISTHTSQGDALVLALDGKGTVTVDGKSYVLEAGESIVMPSELPHAVYAEEKFKMFLVVVFPKK
jgi:quercetin dioxygenase-like cupin family protein